jgi:chromosome segregation ATPase
MDSLFGFFGIDTTNPVDAYKKNITILSGECKTELNSVIIKMDHLKRTIDHEATKPKNDKKIEQLVTRFVELEKKSDNLQKQYNSYNTEIDNINEYIENNKRINNMEKYINASNTLKSAINPRKIDRIMNDYRQSKMTMKNIHSNYKNSQMNELSDSEEDSEEEEEEEYVNEKLQKIKNKKLTSKQKKIQNMVNEIKDQVATSFDREFSSVPVNYDSIDLDERLSQINDTFERK